LVKIKELHQENLKIAKESFYSEVQNLENNFLGQLDQLNSQVDELNARLAHLESLRRQSEDHKDRSKGLDAR
jgi:ubiquinone biosynthesis protein UbiJ